ncbi:MAG: hypothetical protein GY899_13405, partial [Verrucomicrobiaceae bacterium]|nr:hypothetical protein [Verrucomicrobiaceae bacterium]
MNDCSPDVVPGAQFNVADAHDGVADRLTVPSGGVVVVVGGAVVVGGGAVVVGGGASSSSVVADRVWSARLSKALSELPSLTVTVSVVVWSPSMSASSMPVTVTVWAVSQFDAVNVRDAVDTVASPVSPEETSNTTSDVGWALRTTVNVSVVPVSETVVAPPDAATVKPGESSSAVVTATAWSPRASYVLSAVDESLTVTVTSVVWLPSDAESSIPVTVTVWAVSQFDEVNVRAAGETVASPVSADDRENTTLPVGSESRTTVNVSVVPVSDTDAVVP